MASYYRPRENDRHSIEELKKSLERICNRSSSHVWIGGDFNFPGYNWSQNHMKPNCSQPELTRAFLDVMADNGLSQVVTEATYYDNTLDLFFVSNPSIIHNTQVIPGISRDGHSAVYVELDISITRRPKKPRKVYCYKRADWENLKDQMEKECSSIMTTTSEHTPVDDILQLFTTSLNKAIENNIPSKMTKSREKPPWISLEAKRLIRKQKKLFKKQKGCARASRAAQQYHSLKAFTQRSIRKAYWDYVEGIITKTDGEKPATDKKFWKHVKHKRQEAQGVAPLKRNGKLEDDPSVKANMLNE